MDHALYINRVMYPRADLEKRRVTDTGAAANGEAAKTPLQWRHSCGVAAFWSFLATTAAAVLGTAAAGVFDGSPCALMGIHTYVRSVPVWLRFGLTPAYAAAASAVVYGALSAASSSQMTGEQQFHALCCPQTSCTCSHTSGSFMLL